MLHPLALIYTCIAEIHHWGCHADYPRDSWLDNLQVFLWLWLFQCLAVEIDYIVKSHVELGVGCVDVHVKDSCYNIILRCDPLLLTGLKLLFFFFLILMRHKIFNWALYEGCAYLWDVCLDVVRLLKPNVHCFTLEAAPYRKKTHCVCSQIFSFIFNDELRELKERDNVVHEKLNIFRFFDAKCSQGKVHFEFVNYFKEVLCNKPGWAQLVL